ncbi:hypothetical protein EB796_000511 [Bugula neritina]|uniref:Uncharacterized protein n=1 Tax=Bugula neritina TaxID=10212 RepID=A0A7J7KSV1_BUGNE|nr:hypothetical protein EB796_000511 [Bugula neritina]
MQLERKHKMVLYRQAKALKTEVNEKTVKLQEAEKQVERLRNKNTKLKMENSALHARIKERGAVDARLSWDAATGLTQTDIFQQEVQQLQSQLHSTTNDMQAQARKAKARKYDLNYYQARAED